MDVPVQYYLKEEQRSLFLTFHVYSVQQGKLRDASDHDFLSRTSFANMFYRHRIMVERV